MNVKKFKNIKAVFFDAGGTLFRPHPSVGAIYAEVAARYGFTANPQQLESIFHAAWVERDGLASLSGHSTEKKEKEWWRTLVWDVFSKLGRIENFEAFFEELYDRFAGRESWRLFPDTLPVLKELKGRGKIVGIVSNWDSRLFKICEGLGLGPYLDFILASAVVGAAKPSPRIFEEALRRARSVAPDGVAGQDALHVGDSLEDDVLGAERAGLHAVFLDRKGGRTSSAVTITGLQFLSGLIEN